MKTLIELLYEINNEIILINKDLHYVNEKYRNRKRESTLY